MAAAQVIHAILLSGGSAFGLDAAGGVQKYLEERGIGFDVGVTKVPLVCQSDLFDLTVGRMDVRPDAAMGYAACLGAEHNNYRDGNYGAGTGASVGKMTGMGTCMKSGIGSYAVQLGDLKVGAIVAVNSLGDIYNWRDGHKVAGMLTPDCKHFVDSEDVVFADYEVVENKFVGNTTIGVVLTNAAFQKPSSANWLVWRTMVTPVPSARYTPRQTVTAFMPYPLASLPRTRMLSAHWELAL